MEQKLLIITNMGPKPSAPFQGQFVRNQVEALAAIAPTYFYMRWHNDSKLNRLFKYPVLWLQFFWQFILSAQRFDIVHVHYFYPTIWLALSYKWLRNPQVNIVVTCHGSDIYLYKPESRLYKYAASWVRYWIFTSAQLRQKFFQPEVKGEVLAAGIHPTFADSHCLSFAEKQYDVLYVGTLDRNKGMDRLVALLPLLTGLKIAIVGQGPYQQQLAELAAAQAGVDLYQPLSAIELKSYFEQSRCFLSLSRNESFGLVMTEAMACYTPVLATTTDGSLTQIRPGENGWLVSQQHNETDIINEFASSIQRLLTLPAANYRALQQQCRQSAEPYLLDKVAVRLKQIYQSLI